MVLQAALQLPPAAARKLAFAPQHANRPPPAGAADFYIRSFFLYVRFSGARHEKIRMFRETLHIVCATLLFTSVLAHVAPRVLRRGRLAVQRARRVAERARRDALAPKKTREVAIQAGPGLGARRRGAALSREAATQTEWQPRAGELLTCVVCLSDDRATVFACGHACACVPCAKQLSECPLCRRRFSGFKRIFLSV